MDHREVMIKRIEDMGLRIKDVYRKEEDYLRAIHNKEHDKHSVYIDITKECIEGLKELRELYK